MGILFFTYQQLFADAGAFSIEDDSSFRNSLKDTWLNGIPASVLRNQAFTQRLPGGDPVQVRVERGGNEFTVILARQWNDRFPGWGKGSWILTRRLSGEYERIRIFLQSDPNTYIQFRPMENSGKTTDKSFLDVVLYEAYVVRGLSLGIPFENLLTMSLKDILNAAGDKFPAHYFNLDPDMYRDARELVRKVRTFLPELEFADDGALDENNRYVFINNLALQGNGENGGLNCSGFTKWFIDGMLYPLTGRRLSIMPLKAHTVENASSLSQNFSDSLDTWFGLDWTRNLAMEAARVLRSPGAAQIREVEVRKGYFAALIDRNRGSAARSYPGFLMNAGFGLEGLKPLLYTLAINEPGYIYLASVNSELGPAPRMRRHYHDAVLIPYFNEYGIFQTAVFESAAETSLNAFIARYPEQMVNLVRVPIEGRFQPR